LTEIFCLTQRTKKISLFYQFIFLFNVTVKSDCLLFCRNGIAASWVTAPTVVWPRKRSCTSTASAFPPETPTSSATTSSGPSTRTTTDSSTSRSSSWPSTSPRRDVPRRNWTGHSGQTSNRLIQGLKMINSD